MTILSMMRFWPLRCCGLAMVKQDMKITPQQEQRLVAKIRSLSPERVAEVEDFIGFLCHRDLDRRLIRSSAKLSEDVFQKVWDNPDDTEYDQL